MGKRDKRIDAYIRNAPEFARPILTHVRDLVHEACPDVEETIKWRMPTYTHHGILCSTAAFKEHAAFGFWKAGLILTADGKKFGEAYGQLGRLTSVKDLPARKTLIGYVKKAAKLNEDGVQVVRKAKPKAPLVVPVALKAALTGNKKASAAWEAFSPGHRREYAQWISEAKQDATRERRISQAIEWIAAGKKRNWKYEDC
jgi:uncharacterized protein YdeI (YjbR/CyaY-like superfamily)